MRYMILRLISCLCLMTAWYFDVWWLGVPLTLWHCFHYRAYECILIGVCIDVQFMQGVGVPWYTLGATGVVVSAEMLKPLVRRKNQFFEL